MAMGASNTAGLPDELFRALMNEQVSPLVRAAGLKGSSGRYELRSPAGDLAILGIWKSRLAMGLDAVEFHVELGLCLKPWDDYFESVRPSKDTFTNRLAGANLRWRLAPPRQLSRFGFTWVLHDQESRELTWIALEEALTGERGLSFLVSLLDRITVEALLRAGWPSGIETSRSRDLAVLLAARGAVEELDEFIESVDDWTPSFIETFVPWARALARQQS
jgi:hypothetical protein